MAHIITIQGTSNSGKTTTIWAIYRCLASLFNCNPHLFIIGGVECWIQEPMQLMFDNRGNLRDFQSVLMVGDFKIGFISAGDDSRVIPQRITKHINDYKVDILICAIRQSASSSQQNAFNQAIHNFIPIPVVTPTSMPAKNQTMVTATQVIAQVISIVLKQVNNALGTNYQQLNPCPQIPYVQNGLTIGKQTIPLTSQKI